MRFHYRCSDCGKEFRTDGIMYQCPDCAAENDGTRFPKGNLIVELEEEVLRAAASKEHVTPDDFYPYPSPDPDSYPVGITPLMRPRRIQRKLGLPNLSFKLDSQLISGSFKDRASYEVALQAIAHGERKIALASTGNAGAAMSAVGAAMGLDIVLFVPASAPINKLMQSVLYGAHVIPVKGTYDDAFALSIEYTKLFGGINRNTAYNPMTIEGKKSISIELFEQMGRRIPDAVYVPVGDGCRAEYHPAGSEPEILLYPLFVTDASSDLDEHVSPVYYRLYRLEIHEPAVLRAVEIYDMKISGSLLREFSGKRHRILVIDRHLVVIALQQSHYPAISYIYRRKYLHPEITPP